MPRGSKKTQPAASEVEDEARAWQKQAAGAFKALSDPTRLRIFQTLRCAPADTTEPGMTVGQVCERLLDGGSGSIKDPSTISHHLKELRQAGLITMERDGQHRRCQVDHVALAQLAEYLRPQASPKPVSALSVASALETADAVAPVTKTKKTAKS